MIRGHFQDVHKFAPFYHWQPPKMHFGGCHWLSGNSILIERWNYPQLNVQSINAFCRLPLQWQLLQNVYDEILLSMIVVIFIKILWKKGLSCTYKENENLSKTAKADLLVTIRPLLMVSPFACSKSIWHCRFMTAPCSYISCHMKNKELLLAESKPWLYVRSELLSSL